MDFAVKAKGADEAQRVLAVGVERCVWRLIDGELEQETYGERVLIDDGETCKWVAVEDCALVRLASPDQLRGNHG